MDEEHIDAEAPEEDMPSDLYERMTPHTVGEMLAAERRRQGMSLGEIAARTRIREKLLHALEVGEYAQLPSTAYVKGYIQSYATALGIEPAPILEAYQDERRLRESSEPAEMPPGYGRYRDDIVPSREQAHAIPRGVWLVVVALFALGGLVWVVAALIGSEPETTPLPPEVEDTGGPADEGTATPGFTEEELSGAATVTPPASSAEAEPYTVGVVVEGGESWLRVTLGGDVVLEGILEAGSEREWEATGTASVRVGKPSNVTVTKDGEPAPFLPGGEVPTVEFRAD
jgi:cytoskeletal protein RodZ